MDVVGKAGQQNEEADDNDDGLRNDYWVRLDEKNGSWRDADFGKELPGHCDLMNLRMSARNCAKGNEMKPTRYSKVEKSKGNE